MTLIKWCVYTNTHAHAAQKYLTQNHCCIVRVEIKYKTINPGFWIKMLI